MDGDLHKKQLNFFCILYTSLYELKNKGRLSLYEDCKVILCESLTTQKNERKLYKLARTRDQKSIDLDIVKHIRSDGNGALITIYYIKTKSGSTILVNKMKILLEA